jgi:hypothetical protein
MTLSEFEELPQGEQIASLYREGVYIGKRKTAKFSKLLYQLESFYVEVTYSSYRRSIYRIRITDSTTVLEPYLEQINVEYLVL